MTDQNTPDDAAPRSETVVGLITDGAYSLIVARFPTTDEAEDAYRTLTELERRSSLRIDGVVVASRDAEGKVHLGKVTEHSTKTGLRWGLVGGVASSVSSSHRRSSRARSPGGALGAAIGKVGNLSSRSESCRRSSRVS